MTIHNLLFNTLFKRHRPNLKLINFYSSTFVEKELEVPTFCDVHVDLPYSVRIKPLNVHKYHNCDKLILQFSKECEQTLEYDLYGNRVTIVDEKGVADSEVVCRIKAPVKANLYITSKKNISVGYFHGDKLHLESTEGDILVDRYQGDEVDIKTHVGHITLLEFIQASNVNVAVLKKGDITTGRLQSLKTRIETKSGNISVESSYAYDSHFCIGEGNLQLHNAHKSCNVFIKKGHMDLTGFDGKLMSVIESGSANVQISRLTHDSEIKVLNGRLNLKLADTLQDYTQVNVVNTKNLNLAENTKFTLEKGDNDNKIALLPDLNVENTLLVNCKGDVNVESASWQDMIKLKLKK